jgi:hypothetical protein
MISDRRHHKQRPRRRGESRCRLGADGASTSRGRTMCAHRTGTGPAAPRGLRPFLRSVRFLVHELDLRIAELEDVAVLQRYADHLFVIDLRTVGAAQIVEPRPTRHLAQQRVPLAHGGVVEAGPALPRPVCSGSPWLPLDQVLPARCFTHRSRPAKSSGMAIAYRCSPGKSIRQRRLGRPDTGDDRLQCGSTEGAVVDVVTSARRLDRRHLPCRAK